VQAEQQISLVLYLIFIRLGTEHIEGRDESYDAFLAAFHRATNGCLIWAAVEPGRTNDGISPHNEPASLRAADCLATTEDDSIWWW